MLYLVKWYHAIPKFVRLERSKINKTCNCSGVPLWIITTFVFRHKGIHQLESLVPLPGSKQIAILWNDAITEKSKNPKIVKGTNIYNEILVGLKIIIFTLTEDLTERRV